MVRQRQDRTSPAGTKAQLDETFSNFARTPLFDLTAAADEKFTVPDRPTPSGDRYNPVADGLRCGRMNEF